MSAFPMLPFGLMQPIAPTDGASMVGGLGANLRTIQWDLSQLPVFEKNFYIEHPDVTARTEQAAEEWRRSKGITIQGQGIPKPVYTFEEASMPEYVLAEVLRCGFDSPSPIQSQGWPMALLGRDMVGISRTGSGKTLAFLLPGMIHINAQVCARAAAEARAERGARVGGQRGRRRSATKTIGERTYAGRRARRARRGRALRQSRRELARIGRDEMIADRKLEMPAAA